LEKKVKDLSLGGQVFFLGWRDPVDCLAAGDVFVLTSQIESFGVVYAEAMMMGLPCIGSRCSPPSVLSSAEDVIPEGEVGYCVDDVASLQHKLETLQHNPTLRRLLGQKARALADSKYSTQHYVRFFETEAERLLS
jgi:glycosyltransferase involved in cell wall biosynthesis